MRWLLITAALSTGCATGSTMREGYWAGTDFTRTELRLAAELVMTAAEAEDFVRALQENQDLGTPVLTDRVLLLLSVVSDDAARRVLKSDPSLRDPVERIRRNPTRWREVWETFESKWDSPP